MKVVMALSGGMDSTTLLAYLLNKKFEVHPVQFVYGSKHNKYELIAVERIAHHYNLPSVPVLNLEQAFRKIESGLLLTGGDIPEGHYNDSNMSKTVVPGRNSIFISFMTGIAESIGAAGVAIGVHAGDHHIYPDCRNDYILAMNEAMKKASDGKVEVWAPFQLLDKAKIVEEGMFLNVPYFLTRTCYKDQPIACGKCGSCRERLEAFEMNEIPDPVEYESNDWRVSK